MAGGLRRRSDPGLEHLRGERSLSSQDVPQRLVISYVLDLPFGKGKMIPSNNQRGSREGRVRMGRDGVTLFQRGFR